MSVTTNLQHHDPARDAGPFGMSLMRFGGGATLATVVEEADLDFTVSLVDDVQAIDYEGMTVTPIPSAAAIVAHHKDETHGVAVTGRRYRPQQHLATMEKVDPLVREGLLEYAGAGRIGYSKVFVLYRVPDAVKEVAGYPSARHLMHTTAHDGTGSWTWKPWFVDLFCTNQRTAIFNARNAIMRVRHSATANMDERVHEMVSRLLVVAEQEDAFLEALASVEVNAKQVEEFVETVIPDRRDLTADGRHYALMDRGDKKSLTSLLQRREALYDTIYAAPSMNGLREPYARPLTAHVLFHGAVEWSDYSYSARGGATGRGRRILTGADYSFKRSAARTALQIAKVG